MVKGDRPGGLTKRQITVAECKASKVKAINLELGFRRRAPLAVHWDAYGRLEIVGKELTPPVDPGLGIATDLAQTGFGAECKVSVV